MVGYCICGQKSKEFLVEVERNSPDSINRYFDLISLQDFSDKSRDLLQVNATFVVRTLKTLFENVHFDNAVLPAPAGCSWL
jgi:hypothetical protein